MNRETLREALALFAYVKPYRRSFILGLSFIALSALLSSAFPFLIGKMIDAAAPGAPTVIADGGIAAGLGLSIKSSSWSLDTIIGLVFLLLTIQIPLSFMRVYLLTEVSEKSVADIRTDVYKTLLGMPMTFFTEKRVGELSSRISADLAHIQDAISSTLAEFLRGIFTLLIGLVLIVIISIKLTLVMLSVVPVVAILAVVFGKRIQQMSTSAQDSLAESGVIAEETLHGIAIVKAFTSEFFEIGRYTRSIRTVVSTAMRNARYRGAFVGLMFFSVFGTIAFVMWCGARMIQSGELTAGLLTMFVIFTVFVGGTLAGFADLFGHLQKTMGATQSIRELLRGRGEPVDLERVTVMPEFRLHGRVRLDRVVFKYASREDVSVLTNVSLHAERGERVALVGPSGAGKSTIASLLLRFFAPNAGAIFFDERDARNFPLSQLRAQMAYVPQDVALFGGSIRENIAYGKLDASDAEIEAAAASANADDFIRGFPEGYATIVGERGVKLSGGQRQRIAIARAILKDPTILILDEATSSLDTESELLVQGALENLMRNRTSIVIAHRLSTIRNADRILVLDRGVISESGTHDELMARSKGLYRKLIDIQSEAA